MIRFADSKYCFLLCAGLAVSAIASTAVAEEHFPQFKQSLDERDRTVKVVCFGDSVTGIYYHTGGRRAYTKLVQLALEKTKPRATVQAINAGISGHTTRDALARIEKDVLAHKPDLVTVMFGLNDMTRVPLNEYRDNLSKIIEMCRAAGAEVLLCTPNSVYDTKSRPEAKLEKYVAAVHQVAQAQQVEVADCYAAYQSLRSHDEFAWATLMSDEIHPNLDGHKLIAEEIVQAILGRRILLKDIPVSTPPIPWARGKLQKKQPIHILAMPPFDAKIKVAIRRVYPNADIKVTTWETAGKSLSDIEEQAKTVRKMAPDLVVIAVPIETTSSSREQYVRTYSWILNYALSFGLRTWDVIAIDPALASEPSSPEQRTRARLVQQLIRAQDLPFVKRPEENSTPSGDVLKQWVAEQLGKPNTR